MEIDYLLALSEGGLKQYSDADAMNNNIREWFDTPMGTIADNPSWGHPLTMMQHEPGGDDMEVVAEMFIVEKIIQDIDGIGLEGVSVKFIEIDFLQITVSHQYGLYSEAL